MLIERIRQDRLAAMKARDDLTKNLLGTLMAAASKDIKEPDDATVLKTVRSFVKNLDETIAALTEAGKDHAVQDREKAVLEAYLPRTLDEAELRASVAEIVAGLPERSPKAMGQVMAALKAKHGDALDARAASALVKTALG